MSDLEDLVAEHFFMIGDTKLVFTAGGQGQVVDFGDAETAAFVVQVVGMLISEAYRMTPPPEDEIERSWN